MAAGSQARAREPGLATRPSSNNVHVSRRIETKPPRRQSQNTRPWGSTSQNSCAVHIVVPLPTLLLTWTLTDRPLTQINRHAGTGPCAAVNSPPACLRPESSASPRRRDGALVPPEWGMTQRQSVGTQDAELGRAPSLGAACACTSLQFPLPMCRHQLEIAGGGGWVVAASPGKGKAC
jgi:hypothetical protein